MKRVLMLASVASMIDQFNMPNIQLLQEMGYEVDVACNFEKGNTCSDEKIEKLKSTLNEIHVRFYQVDFARDITQVFQNVKAFRQVNQILKKNQYTFIHCHSPIGGVAGRVLGKLNKTKVIYTAHGFHFYKGAPLKNWVIFYPVEKILSRYTDILITINKEDYERAIEKFKAKKTVYIPGVGVDIEKFAPRKSGRKKIREELKIAPGQLMLLSVGELNENKNHVSVIRAIKGWDLTYVIVGQGEEKDYLTKVAKEYGVDLRLIGFRNDVADFYDAADLYILPSVREGLNVSLMEAMASGLPCVVSEIRGNMDLIDDKGGKLFKADSVQDCREAIEEVLISDWKRIGERNERVIKRYSIQRIDRRMKEIYQNLE